MDVIVVIIVYYLIYYNIIRDVFFNYLFTITNLLVLIANYLVEVIKNNKLLI